MVIRGHKLSPNKRNCYCQWLYKGNSLCHGTLRDVSFPGCLKWKQTAAKNPLQFIDNMKKIFRNSLSSRVLLVKCTFLPLDSVGNERNVRMNSVTYQKSTELNSSVLLAPILYIYIYIYVCVCVCVRARARVCVLTILWATVVDHHMYFTVHHIDSVRVPV